MLFGICCYAIRFFIHNLWSHNCRKFWRINGSGFIGRFLKSNEKRSCVLGLTALCPSFIVEATVLNQMPMCYLFFWIESEFFRVLIKQSVKHTRADKVGKYCQNDSYKTSPFWQNDLSSEYPQNSNLKANWLLEIYCIKVTHTYLYGICTVSCISKSTFLIFEGVSLHYLEIAFRSFKFLQS